MSTGHLPLDIDTFVMDQSDTAKEGVSWTYAGVEGYCPMALYLGARGCCLELDLREVSQHSACESEYNIERVAGRRWRQPLASVGSGRRRRLGGRVGGVVAARGGGDYRSGSPGCCSAW